MDQTIIRDQLITLQSLRVGDQLKGRTIVKDSRYHVTSAKEAVVLNFSLNSILIDYAGYLGQ